MAVWPAASASAGPSPNRNPPEDSAGCPARRCRRSNGADSRRRRLESRASRHLDSYDKKSNFNHGSCHAGRINRDEKWDGCFSQKPTKKTKSQKSSADFTDDAENSRERRHPAGVLEIGTVNLPAGCRRSQQQLHQFLSVRISGICGSRLPPRLPSVKVKSRPGASAQNGSGKNGWQSQAGPGLA